MRGSMAPVIACILVSVLVIGCAPKPAEFIMSNLTITPNEVNTGASVTIEVAVTNIGELSGTYEVNLKIDDTIEGTEKVTLDGGASRKVTFTKSKTTARTYSVSIGNLSGTFVVKPKPAEFIMSNLTITPNEVYSGDSVTIQVTVTNIGELSGTYEVNLKIDDTAEGTEKVTLDGGASQKVTFTKSKTTAKTYSVKVENLSGTFVVKSKPTPPPVVSPPPTPPSPTFSGWGPLLWGPEFQVTSGIVSSSLSGVPSKAQDGSTVVNYLVLTTLPIDDQLYYLWTKKPDSPPKLLGTYRLGKIDYAIYSGGKQVPVTFALTIGLGRFAKGEAFEFVLANADKTKVVFWKTIPAPIEIRQGRYRLWVELKSSDGKLFVAWGEGFDPNEEVDIVSTSDSEVLSSKGKADADGRVMVALLPSVVGKTSGLASITLNGKSGEIKVSYEWGPPALIIQ